MLTQEQNDELTQVGPGTPMGTLLRNYWYPVAITRELEDFPVRKARLLGEDWAVYKLPNPGPDGGPEYGIVDARCPHRGASMVYGMVEDDGIRCGYHGWKFDQDGTCVEILAEPDSSAKFREQCGIKSGVAKELGGLIWAYIGDGPAPELPRYSAYVMDGIRDIGHSKLPCNWLQIRTARSNPSLWARRAVKPNSAKTRTKPNTNFEWASSARIGDGPATSESPVAAPPTASAVDSRSCTIAAVPLAQSRRAAPAPRNIGDQ